MVPTAPAPPLANTLVADDDPSAPSSAPLSAGAARDSYRTRGGLVVHRQVEDVPLAGAVEPLIDALDAQRGALLASSYEYPGRYTRWDIGFVNPPLALVAAGRSFQVEALNARGRVLLPTVARALAASPAVRDLQLAPAQVSGRVAEPSGRFAEEERSRQPSIFSVVRALAELFASPAEPHLGLYGAFGYDLAFQFEPIHLRLPRPAGQRDLVLYLPDELLVVDHRRERATRRRYDFAVDGAKTLGLPREGPSEPYTAAVSVPRACDHAPGEYAEVVQAARAAFARGDLFEAVPGQTFFEPAAAPPSELFRRLRERNPSPYGFLLNLGQREHLVGASPEMFVRVEGRRVETCPISGTIARGRDAIEDAERIKTLLNSAKDEAELTMCTDVDRNDKSRVCEPGSVRVIGRRQIELYSRLIHTVDHVEGCLRPGFDALDAFLSHAWAVTVTGAPKAWAMQFLERHERSPRAWYGGAVGLVGFDGSLNTGLTLRTIRVLDGVAEVRVGATLLFDSIPEEEERETRLKAAALLDAIRRPRDQHSSSEAPPTACTGPRVLLVDHQDSFVHTLANYVRQAGGQVTTLRAPLDPVELERLRPQLVLLSPGPGRPADFGVAETVAACIRRGIPVFGVCLGLQGIVEHFGGRLDTLASPVHGKPSTVYTRGGRLFEELPATFRAGRYHSLYADREALPSALLVTAETEDALVMAVEHATLPVAAVQFHPESILSLSEDAGMRILRNALLMAAEPTRLS